MQDLWFIAIVMVVATFLAFEFDVYANENSMTRKAETIELDEALTLGGLLSIGFLIFAWRRYQEQKRETRRRVAAERYSRSVELSRIP